MEGEGGEGSSEDDEDDEGDAQDGSGTEDSHSPAPSPGNEDAYVIDDLNVGSESANTKISKEDKGGKRSLAHQVIDAMRNPDSVPEGLPEACKMDSVGTDFKIKGDIPLGMVEDVPKVANSGNFFSAHYVFNEMHKEENAHVAISGEADLALDASCLRNLTNKFELVPESTKIALDVDGRPWYFFTKLV
ncbi:hypothetical protein U1Q18_017856 [Sarracenia purpurea var. burkii]